MAVPARAQRASSSLTFHSPSTAQGHQHPVEVEGGRVEVVTGVRWLTKTSTWAYVADAVTSAVSTTSAVTTVRSRRPDVPMPAIVRS